MKLKNIVVENDVRVSDMTKGLEHEANNLAVSINGKIWKIFPGGIDGSYEMKLAQNRVAKIVSTLKAKNTTSKIISYATALKATTN